MHFKCIDMSVMYFYVYVCVCNTNNLKDKNVNIELAIVLVMYICCGCFKTNLNEHSTDILAFSRAMILVNAIHRRCFTFC